MIEIRPDWWPKAGVGDEESSNRYVHDQRKFGHDLLDSFSVPRGIDWLLATRATWLGADDKRRVAIAKEVSAGEHGTGVDIDRLREQQPNGMWAINRIVHDEVRKASAVLDILRVPSGTGWVLAARIAWLGAGTDDRVRIEATVRSAAATGKQRLRSV